MKDLEVKTSSEDVFLAIFVKARSFIILCYFSKVNLEELFLKIKLKIKNI